MYSIHPNRHVCTFISGKVRLLILIEAKRQTLPEINVYTRLFGSIEYALAQQKKILALLYWLNYLEFLEDTCTIEPVIRVNYFKINL